jgi:hypothetical protein
MESCTDIYPIREAAEEAIKSIKDSWDWNAKIKQEEPPDDSDCH